MILVLQRRHLVLLSVVFLALMLYTFCARQLIPASTTGNSLSETELTKIVNHLFHLRNQAILQSNLTALGSLFDQHTRYGVWAYEHHAIKTKYLHDWHQKQGAILSNIKSIIWIRRYDPQGEKIRLTLTVSTEYHYVYRNEPKDVNLMRIGTYHSLVLIKKDNDWIIAREWYADPFLDTLTRKTQHAAAETEFILSQKKRDFSELNPRRLKAVAYADEYSGAASNDEFGFKYNSKYRNYNYCGGDCANFVSQVLHEGGGFRKTGAWNYSRGSANRAWSNASAFNQYMLGSGRASRIAYGTYSEVLQKSYQLLPGDYIAYEKNGKVTHVSLVTGADSKGYALTNSHNADRYRVPWDLGYGGRRIRFYLVRVHY